MRLFTASPRCVLQPEDSFGLTVTWTPSEEGAIRELILFSANGVLKLQAVLLGRAEAPKKKKVHRGCCGDVDVVIINRLVGRKGVGMVEEMFVS